MSRTFCARWAGLLCILAACGFGGCGTSFESAKFAPRSSTTDTPAPDMAAGHPAPVEGDVRSNEVEFNTEAYDRIVENAFLRVTQYPLSTFSIDVDTASYSNVRRFLVQGQLPPKGAVRVEEMINYFTYDYPQPQKDVPFSVNIEAAECP